MLARRVVSALPDRLQWALRDAWYAHRIRQGTFTSDELGFERLTYWLRPSDVAIDVGANIGVWTRRMAEAVGPTGAVYAFEPMPHTFRALTKAVRGQPWVRAVNAAASDHTGTAYMSAPEEDGLENHYQSAISDTGEVVVQVTTIDTLGLSPKLIKIDAEGHDQRVIDGARATIERARPIILTEEDVEIPGYFPIERGSNTIWVHG
jgi:FkbM family methyltransferase